MGCGVMNPAVILYTAEGEPVEIPLEGGGYYALSVRDFESRVFLEEILDELKLMNRHLNSLTELED
jgi:hypothetical protein